MRSASALKLRAILVKVLYTVRKRARALKKVLETEEEKNHCESKLKCERISKGKKIEIKGRTLNGLIARGS